MRPISQAMQQVTLDPSANPVVIVEARVEQTADIRQRSDQWAQADGGLSANLEVLADGGLRLKPTAGAAAGPTVQNAWFRPREPGNSGIFIDYCDPIGSPVNHIVGLRGQWNGTAANVAYSQVQAWLNPRFDTTKPKLVQTWQLIIYQLVYKYLPSVSGALTLSYGLAPVATAQVAALGEAAGWVVFTFQDASGKSTPWHPERYLQPLLPGTNISEQVGPEYFISCSGQDSKGHRVLNVAWGYDNTQTQFASGGAGNQIVLTAASYGQPTTGQSLLPTFRAPAGLPALQFLPVSYAASATVTFKTGTPIDLGIAPTDASLVEFIVQPEVPLGTTVLAEAAVDPAGAFTTVKSGQTAAALALAAQRKYDIRATLSANANADRTPILRLLGARLVAAVDLGNLVEVIELNEHTDPITHQSEVESCVIRCYHDGERDYRDPISLLLSQNPPGQFYFRLYVGDRRLPKDQWVYHDDFYPQDVELQEAYTDIHCVSCLSQLKQELPVLSSDTVAAPSATSSNPGSWTASSGTDLAAQIADLPEPQWAATTAYIIGSRVIDANSNVQIATTDGTSGGSAPSWGTTLGSYTVDSGVTWQNLGALASGLPDDATYIQSPNNPANADYIVNLGKIGTPQQSVGATIQFRAATVGAAQSLGCTVILREGTTPRATKAVTVNVQDTGQGSYLVFQYLLTAAEQAAIGNWGNLNFLVRANGTGGIRVSWARLVVLGRRAPYVSSAIGTSAQQIMDDLINNQVALDARLKGPQYADTTPALVVSKTIEQDASGGTDLARSLDELQRLAWITGTFYMSSQGRLTNRPFYQVQTGTDLITGTTTATYMPLIGPIRAILGPGEFDPIAITPGWRQRIPLFRVPWGWNGQNWGGEAQVVNAPALTYYRQDLIEADPRCPTETSKWISGQGLGNGLSARHGQMFGLGLMEWRFRCIYPHPEWERGDVITVPTDRFLGYDPISTRAIAGRQWATGVIVGRHDALGREWSIWIQSLSAIRPIAGALAFPPFSSLNPNTLGVSGYVGEQAGDTTGLALNVFWAGSPAVQAVRIGVALLSNGALAPGSGSLFVGNSGVATLAGPYLFGSVYVVTITPYATVDGTQALGRAAYCVKSIDGSSISTGYNNQGSMPPTAVLANFFTYASAGPSLHMWLSWGWNATAITRADGSTLNIPAAPAAPAAPTLSQVAGGALGARTRWARIAYVKSRRLYPVSGESSFVLTANNLLKVQAPADPGGGLYDGWAVLVGSVSNGEIFQSRTEVFGVDWTEPVGGFVTTFSPWSASWKSITAVELSDNVTVQEYGFYNLGLAQMRVVGGGANDGPSISTSVAAAAKQNADGMVPLSFGAMAAIIPVGGGSNGGNGGGKFL